MIRIKDLEFEYYERDEEENLTDMINAIRGINFDAGKGDFIAVAGRNGSGKSTFAKILNCLITPIDGTVLIGGIDAINGTDEDIFKIRKKVGMVFQNPDNQIIGSVVAEDIAFGAENIGISSDELWERVFEALSDSGLGARMADIKIDELSGGEKQKVAIAGVLAMKPACIVLDEATSMLDNKSRWEILKSIKEINEKLGITIIMITHNMDELLIADYIYIMDKGRIFLRGKKESIFANKEMLKQAGLECPAIIDIKNDLVRSGIIHDGRIFSVEAMVKRIKYEHPNSFFLDTKLEKNHIVKPKINPVNAILFNHAKYSYNKESVLKDISLSIGKDEYVVIIGGTGAGKSTLLKLIPGLVKTDTDMIYVDGVDVMDKSTDLSNLRKKLGFVFQYPEQQLFAKNVYEDVVFGPRNTGITEVEAEKRAYEAIEVVGLSDEIYDMPINKLSGGEKRRVALAGVLAMQPEYLILDEPLSGLDPEGKQNMLDIIEALHKEAGITIVMVSHDMESVVKYADRLIAIEDGEVLADGIPENVFYEMYLEADEKERELYNLPVIMQLLISLRREGLEVSCLVKDIDEGVNNIKKALNID
ncbi:MAG: ATP-binding cassette domain-containing protein [Lachnospiraceae bacterium]|nr:ATP-binding cassette domain-containing protein [Lachnospiraceae bacterium]